MLSRHLLAFAVAALALGALATSLSRISMSVSMAQSAPPDSTVHSATISEMVTTQGWPWDFFGGRGSQPQRLEPLREPRTGGEPGEQENESRRRLGASGTYRTVCVRLCDGFYWPISHATTRDRFARDTKQCEQACPSRSRLFVHRTSDVDEPAAMKGLEGRAYEKLENAFRHQREYVAECTCKGNPWDEEALTRHRAYAEAAQAEKEKPVATAEKPRSGQARRERGGGRSQRLARSGSRDRGGDED